MHENEVSQVSDNEPERFQEEELVDIGQWYWATTRNYEEEVETWLCCVTEIGSNYVRVESPGGSYCKVHFDEFDKVLKREPNHQKHIASEITKHKNESNRLLGKIKEVTARLGMEQQTFIGHQSQQQASSRALAVMSNAVDPKAYERDLKKAKEKTLPELFKKMEESNKELTTWMKAESIPLKAMQGLLGGLVEGIDGRIFNVSLYAGLLESVVTIQNGKSAPFNAKLHIMQRKLYMDEESLLYIADGGMGFDQIEQFDQWMLRPENFSRIFPFERCMVCFQVRRKQKDYEWDGSLAGAFEVADKIRADKLTFMYIRNGDNLHCLACDLKFDDLIFPSKNSFDPSVPMMMKKDYKEIYFMSVAEYEERLQEYNEWKERVSREEKERVAWKRKHLGPEPEREDFSLNADGTVTYHSPGMVYEKDEPEDGEIHEDEDEGFTSDEVNEIITFEDVQNEAKDKEEVTTIGGYRKPLREEWDKDPTGWAYLWRHDVWRKKLDYTPYGGYFHANRYYDFNPKEWGPFNSSNVDFDLGSKKIAKQIEHYNRIALLVQGIYDRSMLLHPHPPVRLYQPGGFEEAVELVYDGSGVLYHGDPPVVEPYMIENNAAIDANSVVMGHYQKWHVEEEKKDKNWKWWNHDKRFSLPSGNDGPPQISKMLKYNPRTRNGTFSWTRERQTTDEWKGKHWGDPIFTSFTCSVDGLFNLSAYKPGDMRQFYEDPRTRQDYLKWARKFILAERFCRGEIVVPEPLRKEDVK